MESPGCGDYNPAVATFLSDEWMNAVIGALRGSADESLPDAEFTLQQLVSGTPQGVVSLWTTFDTGRVDGGLGDAPSPSDVTFAMEYETATALARGELNHQAAFMQGKLKVTGNMGKLLENQDALQALGPAMAAVDTQY